jgi:hypothetical protein
MAAPKGQGSVTSCIWFGLRGTLTISTMWFLASLLLLLLPSARAGVCPRTVDPVFSLTFSQEGCRNGQFTTDDGVFHVSRSVASTTCVHSPEVGFNYTMPGVQITNPNVSVSDFSGSGKYTDWTSDLHTPIYMALVFEPKTIPDKYRSGLQNSDRGFHSFCTLYFGNLQRNNLYRIWDDLGSDLSLGRDSIQANDRLRFGTSVISGMYPSAQSAILQQFSWFSKALSLSEVQARFATSFPNALPVVKNIWLTFLQQQSSSLAVLNTSAVV